MRSPNCLIESMNLSPEDKLAIFLIIKKVSSANRIDIHEGMEPPDLVKIALFKMGLFSVPVPTSEKPSHICGLSVARSKEEAEAFAKAIRENDEIKTRRLMGYQVSFPITKRKMHIIKLLQDQLPEFYNELVHGKRIIAA